MFDHRPWIRPPTNPFTDQELLDAPTDGRHGRAVTVQRHEVLDWLGPVDLYADRAEPVEDLVPLDSHERSSRPRPVTRPCSSRP